MSGLLVGGCVGGRHDGVDDADGDRFFSSDRRILDPVGFKLPGSRMSNPPLAWESVGLQGSGISARM